MLGTDHSLHEIPGQSLQNISRHATNNLSDTCPHHNDWEAEPTHPISFFQNLPEITNSAIFGLPMHLVPNLQILYSPTT